MAYNKSDNADEIPEIVEGSYEEDYSGCAQHFPRGYRLVSKPDIFKPEFKRKSDLPEQKYSKPEPKRSVSQNAEPDNCLEGAGADHMSVSAPWDPVTAFEDCIDFIPPRKR